MEISQSANRLLIEDDRQGLEYIGVCVCVRLYVCECVCNSGVRNINGRMVKVSNCGLLYVKRMHVRRRMDALWDAVLTAFNWFGV